MKITIEHETEKATIETQAVNIDECLDCCLKALHAIGFHMDSIERAIQDRDYDAD